VNQPRTVADDVETAPQGLDRQTRRTVVLLALAAVLVLAAGLGIASLREGTDPDTDPLVADNLIDPGLPMPDLVLTDTDGEPFDLRAETAGRTTLFYLGYVNCPDVCPITTAVLARTMETASADVRDEVQVVFVSVDPARDTLPEIRTYLDSFDPSFIGLQATTEQLEDLQVALNAPLATAESPDPEGGYLVGHASAVYLFDQNAAAVYRFPFGTRQSDWERLLPQLVGV
jgi:protein SCO1/2